MEVAQSEDLNLTTTNTVLNNILKGVNKQFIDVRGNAQSSYDYHAMAADTSIKTRKVASQIERRYLPRYYQAFETLGRSGSDISALKWWRE